MNKRDVIDAAWFEFIVARAYTGAPPSHEVQSRKGPREWWAARSTAPGWFIRDELGFDVASGPSLEWTCRRLVTMNKDAMMMLGPEAPYKVTWPRQ